MNVEIRPQEYADNDSVCSVLVRVYRGDDEARLIERLQEAEADIISLVALVEGKIVGLALFSPMSFDPDAGPDALGLAPLAVLPKYQRQGIGSKLVRRGLDQALSMNYALAFVLGNPAFFHRFGFVTAAKYNYFCEYKVPDENFMVNFLRPKPTALFPASVSYSSAFKAIENEDRPV
jgi:putative acetyltransferase